MTVKMTINSVLVVFLVLSSWTVSNVRSQPSSTGPQLCGNFQTYLGKHYLNAEPQAGITTQADCEQLCLNDGTCLGYEIDTNPADPLCWIHHNAINRNDLYDDPFLTLYVFIGPVPCTTAGSSGPSESATFSTTTTAAVPPTGGGCGAFTAYPGSHAIGAEPLAGVNDPQVCLDNCVTNPVCTAYEFTTNPNEAIKCWFHTAPVNATTDLFNDDNLITIYIFNRFPCTSTVSGSTTTGTTSLTTTSRGSGGGLGQCFQSLPNTNALNAQPFAEARTDQECRTICLGNAMCTAYETDNFGGTFECWLHLAPIPELYNTDGVTINLRISCDSTTGGSTTTVSGNPGQCVVFGPGIVGTQSIGATGHQVPDSQCPDICRADPTCVAYEIDTALIIRCWIHQDPNDLLVVYDSNSVTQYRVLSRECVTSVSTTTGSTTTTPTVPGVCATYTRLDRTQSVGAVPQSDIASGSASLCENRCTTNALCVAYELDTNPVSPAYCWIHTNATNLLTLYDAPTVTQFQVNSRDCSTVSGSTSSTVTTTTSSGSTGTGSTTTGSTTTSLTTTTTPGSGQCAFTWTQINDVNIPGGTPNRAGDLPSCQDACTRNLYCIGIDVNTGDDIFVCFLVTVDIPLTPYPGNTHYTLTRSAGCPTGPPTETPTTIPTTTVTQNPTTGCTSFRVSVGYNADGGFLEGRMTRGDCILRCLSNPTCLAVDFAEADQLCFSHTTLAGAQLATCCVRYECASSPCTDQYVRYSDRSPNLSLGEVQNGVTDRVSCQAACVTKNCSRFSFINAARNPQQSCYLYYSNTAAAGRDATTVQVGIDLYVRKRCIDSPALPPTTTLTSPATVGPNYCPLDLLFIIDSSGSIRDNQPPGVDNWSLIKAFVKDIIQTYLSVGTQTDHVSIITFSDGAIRNFDFNRYQDLSAMLTAIDNLPFIGYETNTPAAINLGAQTFTDSIYGARNRSAKFACLVTDGVVSPQWLDQYEPSIANINQVVKNRGAVGVTTQIDVGELYQYTGSQDAVTTVLSFQDLSKVRATIGTLINSVDCNGNRILTSPLTTTGPTVSTLSTVSNGQPGSSSSTGSTVTTLSTVTTTTTAAPTTTPTPKGGEGTFGAITRTSTTGQADPLKFPTLLANRNNVYISATDSYVATAVSGFYFIEICAGSISGTSTEVATRGAYPPLAYVWQSTAHNGVTSNCRSGVLSMTRGVRIYVQQLGGGAYSDNNVQTSWSIFSITDVIRSPLSVLSAVHRQPVSAPAVIPFVNPTANPPGQYDPSRYQYLCSTSGIFFFSFSAGVPGGQTAAVRLVGLNNVYEITSTSTTPNSVITIDRSVVVQCSSGRVSVQVTAGQITPGGSSQNLISFQGFPYQLPVDGMQAAESAAWGLYKTSSVSANSVATDPLPFEVTEVTQGVNYNNGAVTLTYGGYYYIYISAGCPAGQRVLVTLRVNSQVMFSINRQSSNDNGMQTLGQGLVLFLQAGDVIKVVNEPNSAIFSSNDGLHTSFIGIRLYAS